MQGSSSRGKGGMSMQGCPPENGRHCQCRVAPCREREAWQMQGSTCQGKGGMANAG